MNAPTAFYTLGLLLVPALPLALAVGLVAPRTRRLSLRLAPWAAFPALVVALLLPVDTVVEIPWLLLGTRLGLDETGQVFLALTAALWWLSGLFASRYLSHDPRQSVFFAFFLLALAGNLGLVLALDLAGYFFFFALMSFSSYGLVVHTRDPDALRAGRVYITLVILGEALLFYAVVAIAAGGSTALPNADASTSNLVIGLVLLGFGIKAGALPLHVWLPLAHPAAPVPASAVLSGAMIKAGLLGWIRFLPMGEETFPEWGLGLAAAGLGAAFYGVAVGLTQTNPKTVLAYSSISQMGLMTVLVGLGLASPEGWPLALAALLIYAVHHGLAKGALFLSVGVAAHAGAQRIWVLLGALIPALALAGLPLTSGAVAKVALKGAAIEAGVHWAAWLDSLLPVSALGTTALMARFLVTLWSAEAGHHHRVGGLWPIWLALLITVIATLWIWPFAAEPARISLGADKLFAAAWPVVIGSVIGLAVLGLTARRHARRHPWVPAGDILALLGPAGWVARISAVGDAVEAVEARLRRWPTAGMLLLTVTVVLLAVMLSSG